MLSLHLFNIFMKPLREVIHYQGERYHQNDDNSLLYISAFVELYAATALSWSLEAVEVGMGNNRPKLNLGKMEWLWVWGSLGFEELSSVVKNGVGTALDRPGA